MATKHEPKLHELLAVESDKEGTFKKMVEEAVTVFSKHPDRFFGFHKKLESLVEDENVEAAEEHHEMTTTVHDKLSWISGFIIDYIDVVVQKEKTNQKAHANLIIDGKVITENLPATFLLGLETKFKRIRELFMAIPTLPPGISWKESEQRGAHVYEAEHPEKKYKTAKTFQHKVLYDATKEHPAQIERWEETRNVGIYVTERWCGMISPKEKADFLLKVDKIIQACKKARQRANCEPVVDITIGKELINFIMK